MYDIVLIDGNNFARRALHSHDSLSVKKESGKIPTGMLYGFFEIVITLMNSFEGNPKVYVVWDKGRNKRKAIYPGYKGSRDVKEVDPKKQKKKDEMNLKFKHQMNMIKPILKASGIYQAFVKGEEADDTIGTLAYKLSSKGNKVLIATGDHDMLQLIKEDVDLYMARPKGNQFWDVSKFERKYEILPEKMIDVMSLMGDSGDDIPGIKGIGESKALKIVKSNLDLVDRIIMGSEITPESILGNVSAREKDLIVNNLEVVRMANKLVKIDVNIKPITIVKPKKDLDRLEEIFEFLEFNSFLKKNQWEFFEKLGEEDVEG